MPVGWGAAWGGQRDELMKWEDEEKLDAVRQCGSAKTRGGARHEWCALAAGWLSTGFST